MTLPLEDIRVLDLTQIWSGPYCTMMLGALGAQVIKVESVQRPEPIRGSGADASSERPWEASPLYQSFNLNKLDITLDLAQAEGRHLLLALAGICDVVIENFTAGTMNRWGLGYETLRCRRPDILYLSMPGFGSDGPYASYRALGTTMEAMAGFTWLTGYPGGPPMRCGLNYGDPVAALNATFALLAAIRFRRQTGTGQHLELSQHEGLVSLLPGPILDFAMNGRDQSRRGNEEEGKAPQGCYPCAGEDKWVAISATHNQEWRRLCQVMTRPDLATDRRFRGARARWDNREALDEEIAIWTRKSSARQIMQTLQQSEIPAGAVYAVADILDDPHLRSRGAFRTVDHPLAGNQVMREIPWRLSGTPVAIRSRAPLFGEHNEFILAKVLGLTEEALYALRQKRVIGDRPMPA